MNENFISKCVINFVIIVTKETIGKITNSLEWHL